MGGRVANLMSRQYPLPNDLITADLLQQVTDGQPKPFRTAAERFAAFHRPVTDLRNPEPGRPPKKGETSVITDGTWAGIQVFNGTSWKPLRQPANVLPATIGIADTAISSLPGNASFPVTLLNPPGKTKVIVHYIVEAYNPVPDPLRDASIVPTELQAGTAVWGSRNTPPTARIVPGTDFPLLVGSLVYDPSGSSDFGGSPLVANILVRVEASAAFGNRFQVRLFDPLNVRLTEDTGICVIEPTGISRPRVRVDDTRVVTALQAGLKPDDPALIQATTASFPLSYVGGTNSANATYSTISGTAVEGEDFSPVNNQAFGTNNTSRLDVAIPAQLVETDEYFIIEVTPTDDNIDWTRRTAFCWIEGNPSNPIVILPQSRTIQSDGLDRDIEIPFFVLPASSADLSFRYWIDLGTEEDLETGVDYPDIIQSNPATFIIRAGTSSGTLRIPFYWFNRMASLPEVTNRTVFLHLRYEGDSLSSSYTDLRLIYDNRASVVRLPQLTPGNNVRPEEHGQLDFPLTLDRPPPVGTTATVDFTTIGLSATPGDYDKPSSVPTGVTYNPKRDPDGPPEEISGQVAFTAAGDDDGTARVLRFAITSDSLLEEDERLRIRFTNPVRCQLVRDEATGVIRNDDLASAVTGIPDLTLRDGTVVGNTMQFEARLSRPATSSVTFDVTTADGSASSGTDYVPVINRRVVIGAGRLSAFVVVGLVPPIGDTAAETFLLTATNLSGNANPVRLTARGIIPAV